MPKTIVTYRNCKGVEERIEITGDFQIGREKTRDGPMLTMSVESGEVAHLVDCPLSVSRIKMNTGRECLSCHLSIFWKNEVLYIQDMGSTNGTKMNGATLRGWTRKNPSEPVRIQGESLIELGETEIRMEPDTPQVNPLFRKLGIDKVISRVPDGGVININIGTLEGDNKVIKHVESQNIDVVANRSRIDLSDEEVDGDRDLVSNREKRTPFDEDD